MMQIKRCWPKKLIIESKITFDNIINNSEIIVKLKEVNEKFR